MVENKLSKRVKHESYYQARFSGVLDEIAFEHNLKALCIARGDTILTLTKDEGESIDMKLLVKVGQRVLSCMKEAFGEEPDSVTVRTLARKVFMKRFSMHGVDDFFLAAVLPENMLYFRRLLHSLIKIIREIALL